MKAAIYTEYGSPEVLQFQEVAKPIPKKNELLIHVHASTVSAGAVWIRKGQFPGSKLFTFLLRLQFGLFRPKQPILGVEFSGIIEAVGDEVSLFKKGDAVYGTTTGLKNGAYADYVCIPESRTQGVVAIKPHQLSFAEAAALPVGGMTALQILAKVPIRAGHRILIYGASGSVGSYAVQIAKYFGATVTAVCSTANVELVKSIGTDEVIDYTKDDLGRFNGRFDIVFEAVGKVKSSALKPLLNPTGKFCSIKSLTAEKTKYLDFLHQMIANGQLKPVIDRVYPFDQIVEAHKYVDLGHKKGNVVLNHPEKTSR